MIQENDKKDISAKREKQTRYLAQAIQLEEAVNPHIIRATMSMVSIAIIIFLVWAGLTNVNEVAHTPGEVVPRGFQQTVQHLEGGIIKEIHVHEGDIVTKGQVLISLDKASINKDFERTKSKQLTLDLQAERLRAFIQGREPDFSKFKGVTDKMIADQSAFFEDMRHARIKEEEIILDQIRQKKQSLDSLSAELGTAQENFKITDDVYQRRLSLNEKGYTSDIQLLETQKQRNELKGETARIKNQILIATSEIAEFEGRLESLSAQHRDEANEKLDQVIAEKSQNIEVIQKLEERIGRLQIRSPSHGMVKGLAVNTIGAVIQPGQVLMEIVPLDEKLEVLVKISPKDIGHLKAGHPVQVKFSTYDFSRYGTITGRLQNISATTFTGEEGERFYRGRVLLEKNYVGNNPDNILLPGMTVMADVITGEKTILQYMLRPIHQSLKTAFTER